MTLALVGGLWLGLALLGYVMVRYCQREDRSSNAADDPSTTASRADTTSDHG